MKSDRKKEKKTGRFRPFALRNRIFRYRMDMRGGNLRSAVARSLRRRQQQRDKPVEHRSERNYDTVECQRDDRCPRFKASLKHAPAPRPEVYFTLILDFKTYPTCHGPICCFSKKQRVGILNKFPLHKKSRFYYYFSHREWKSSD